MVNLPAKSARKLHRSSLRSRRAPHLQCEQARTCCSVRSGFRAAPSSVPPPFPPALCSLLAAGMAGAPAGADGQRCFRALWDAPSPGPLAPGAGGARGRERERERERNREPNPGSGNRYRAGHPHTPAIRPAPPKAGTQGCGDMWMPQEVLNARMAIKQRYCYGVVGYY